MGNMTFNSKTFVESQKKFIILFWMVFIVTIISIPLFLFMMLMDGFSFKMILAILLFLLVSKYLYDMKQPQLERTLAKVSFANDMFNIIYQSLISNGKKYDQYVDINSIVAVELHKIQDIRLMCATEDNDHLALFRIIGNVRVSKSINNSCIKSCNEWSLLVPYKEVDILSNNIEKYLGVKVLIMER